ncbi:hypothetical protein TNCV_2022181 [Trichonephila clavipes]|nr:hypothetical protein TNCV_2022181 [Trichonephila clavipes]
MDSLYSQHGFQAVRKTRLELVCGYDSRYSKERYPVSEEVFATDSAEISLRGMTSGNRNYHTHLEEEYANYGNHQMSRIVRHNDESVRGEVSSKEWWQRKFYVEQIVGRTGMWTITTLEVSEELRNHPECHIQALATTPR